MAGAAILSTAGPDTARAQANLQPRLPDLSEIVKDEKWAKILGKALFWDQLVGSDGMACASCHFHAGADVRIKNQLSPGFLQKPTLDKTFGATVAADPGDLGETFSGSKSGPNYELKAGDFPFHQLFDKKDRNSNIVMTTNDRVSSAGAYDAPFGNVNVIGTETCGAALADVFHANGPNKYPARQVEPRNTPTMINAVFFDRNFWDGRANNIFNGKGVFGWRDIDNDPNARIIVREGGLTKLEILTLTDSSLASQAVGPPLSNLEMSCGGRTFADVGRKVLTLVNRPLANQSIHADDSLLGRPGPYGDIRQPLGRGLRFPYMDLVRRAFHDKYWSDVGRFEIKNGQIVISPLNGYTQMEHNFSLFWGLSIMLYESTLISDQSRFDQANALVNGCMTPAAAGSCRANNPAISNTIGTVLTQEEKNGQALFVSTGLCSACHSGSLLSLAAASAAEPPVRSVFRLPQADPSPNSPGTCTYNDLGFFGVGVRPTTEDVSAGGTDPYGKPLSFTRQYMNWLAAGKPEDPTKSQYILDRFSTNPLDPKGPLFLVIPPAGINCGPNAQPDNKRIKIDGAFKTPGLRNVALTPPYFHYGGYASLEQLIEFYARGGSRRDMSLEIAGATGDNSGTGPLGDTAIPVAGPHFGRNVNDNLRLLDLTLGGTITQDQGQAALVAFLKSLTDARVQCDQGPFDHPELRIFSGHADTDSNEDGKADDTVFTLPAVGKDGYSGANAKFCIPNAGDLFAPGFLARIGK